MENSEEWFGDQFPLEVVQEKYKGAYISEIKVKTQFFVLKFLVIIMYQKLKFLMKLEKL